MQANSTPDPNTWQRKADRFWSKVEKTETCWLWRGTLFPNGYGAYSADRTRHAHRFAWLLTHGSLQSLDYLFVTVVMYVLV